MMGLTGCSSLNCRQISACKDSGISDSLYAKIHAHHPLTVADVSELSASNMRSSEIMTYLAYTNSTFALTDSDVAMLERENVNGDVITYMRENPNRTGGLISTFTPGFLAE
jgi:glucosamine 6-phosphate synthetase-like amidotransferase/phosphosugar isomerase protein